MMQRMKIGLDSERQILQSRNLGLACLILVFPWEQVDLDKY